eukprot:TRINITY_DN19170_c0_g1_i1.p1 TRINITY_DN19170_c0_g1~~TRINITY_DN19170_c0_g1_i1.p1  ORF type:complete len:265 (-),score=20.21 TRINITY_DN19170_c0_g1_i1:368-1084(-)
MVKLFRRSLPVFFAAFVAWLLKPIVEPEKPTISYDLDKVEDWGLKGPAKDMPFPYMGVYVFAGLNPALIIDFSQIRYFDTVSRSFWVQMSDVIFVDNGKQSDWTNTPYASNLTEFLPPGFMTGKMALPGFSALRYWVKFNFDKDWKNAYLESCFIHCHLFPGSYVYTYSNRETFEWQPGNVWLRKNHIPYWSTESLLTYSLYPLKLKGEPVNKTNLAYAKGKLYAGSKGNRAIGYKFN